MQAIRPFFHLERQHTTRRHGDHNNARRSCRPRVEQLEARALFTVIADFNGDGFSDLAAGVPGENNGAGAVNVIYGSANGLTTVVKSSGGLISAPIFPANQ